MKKIFYYLFIGVSLCFTGCSRNVSLDDVYKGLEGNRYSVQRCYKYYDNNYNEYKYQLSFELEFLKNNEVKFIFKNFNCISDLCYNELDDYFIVYPITNLESESAIFNYVIEKDDNYKIVFQDKKDGTYFNIDDITFSYENDRIKNFGINGGKCLDIDTLVQDEELEHEEDVSDEFYETDNVHAELCAINAVKNKLSRYSRINVDVSSVMVNDKTMQYIVKGNVSYQNEYNAKLNYSFTCQIKELSSCDSSVLLY